MPRTSVASSSSMEPWLAGRVSFSRDFAPQSATTMAPARASSTKGSPSEFEFSMSINEQDGSYDNTMLPADELFQDGKLLPLYNQQNVAPPGPDIVTSAVPRRRSNASDNSLAQPNAQNSEQVASTRVEPNPISPKAPTCTSRWKELLGLKKAQNQEGKDSPHNGRSHGKHDHLLPARRSMDAGLKLRAAASMHGDHQDQGTHLFSHHSTADPGLYPSAPPKARSKATDDSEIHYSSGRGTVSVVAAADAKHRGGGRAKSPTRGGAGGSAGMSPPKRGGTSGGNKPTNSMEASRSTTMATRLVVKGLDRSSSSSSNNSSSPKPPKKKPKQVRAGARQRGGGAGVEGPRTLERSPSYSAGIRVSPVINVPLYIGPGLRKGSKNGSFSLTHLFGSNKKDVKALPSCHYPSHHHHHHHQQHHHHHRSQEQG